MLEGLERLGVREEVERTGFPAGYSYLVLKTGELADLILAWACSTAVRPSPTTCILDSIGSPRSRCGDSPNIRRYAFASIRA